MATFVTGWGEFLEHAARAFRELFGLSTSEERIARVWILAIHQEVAPLLPILRELADARLLEAIAALARARAEGVRAEASLVMADAAHLSAEAVQALVADLHRLLEQHGGQPHDAESVVRGLEQAIARHVGASLDGEQQRRLAALAWMALAQVLDAARSHVTLPGGGPPRPDGTSGRGRAA